MSIKLAPDTMVEIMRKMLKVGVPPTAIANVFDLDPEVTKALLITMRRERYGTAELSEAMSFLTWEAIEELHRMIRNGATDVRAKAVMQVVSKALATSVRQTPEEVARGRAELLKVISENQLIDLEGVEDDLDISSFAASDEQIDDQG